MQKPAEKPAEKPEEKPAEKTEAKPAAAAPVLKDKVIKLENNGQILSIKFIIKATAKPTALWNFAGMPVKSGGRYFLNVQPSKTDKEEFTIIFECKSVSVKLIKVDNSEI